MLGPVLGVSVDQSCSPHRAVVTISSELKHESFGGFVGGE